MGAKSLKEWGKLNPELKPLIAGGDFVEILANICAPPPSIYTSTHTNDPAFYTSEELDSAMVQQLARPPQMPVQS